MRNTKERAKKWALVTSALLVTCALSSCSMPRTFSAFMGEERYLPDGSEQTFGAPRRPILNPLNNYPAPTNDEMSASQDYARPAVSSHASMGKRRMPAENVAILSGKTVPAHTAAFAAPVALVDTALSDSLKKPIEAEVAVEPKAMTAVAQDWSAPQETKEAPVSFAPVVPSEPVSETTPTVIKLTPPSVPKPGERAGNAEPTPTLAATPAVTDEKLAEEKVVAVVTKPAMDATETTPSDAAPTEYPSLASIPEAPEATPAEKIAADITSLGADRANNQSAAQALLNTVDSTVMTSPETGQMVANAATAMPTMEPAAGKKAGEKQAAPTGESAWLNNLLGPTEKKAEEQADGSDQPQDLTVPPAAAVEPVAIGTPVVMKQLAYAGQSDTPTQQTAAAPVNEAAAVVTAAKEAAPMPVVSSSDTVQLRPPATVAEAVAVKADQQLTEIVEQPVEEVQPTVKKAVQYLPESRYAKRRLTPVNEAY